MAGRSVLERIYATSVGPAVARRADLVDPPVLRRGRVRPDGPDRAGGGGVLVGRTLDALGLVGTGPLRDEPDHRTRDADGRVRPPAYHARLGALIIDATGVRTIADLEPVRAMLRPAMREMGESGGSARRSRTRCRATAPP